MTPNKQIIDIAINSMKVDEAVDCLTGALKRMGYDVVIKSNKPNRPKKAIKVKRVIDLKLDLTPSQLK